MDFTVVAFNAHWGIGRFGKFRNVHFDVASLVREYDGDIVVIAESFRFEDGRGILDSLRDTYTVESLELMDMSKRRDRSGRRDGAPRSGTWELAVCSRFPVRTRRTIPLGDVGTDPVWERHALAVTVDIDGTEVEVIGIHTSSRLQVLAPIRHLLGAKRHLTHNGPQVLAGDFNFWGPPVALMMRGWQRPVRGRTYPSHRPHSQIDHVLVRGGIQPLSGEVLEATPSDHRPVRARLRL